MAKDTYVRFAVRMTSYFHSMTIVVRVQLVLPFSTRNAFMGKIRRVPNVNDLQKKCPTTFNCTPPHDKPLTNKDCNILFFILLLTIIWLIF